MELLSHVVQDLDTASGADAEESALRLSCPSSNSNAKVQQSWTKCNKDLIQIKYILKEMDNEIKSAPNNKNTTTKTTLIMKNQYSLLLHKYLELMQKFQSTQQKNREAFKQNIARQIRIVKPDAADEEVAQVIRDGVTNVFTAQIGMVSMQKNKAKDLMIDIQEQHNEVLRIEKSIYVTA
jgi:t-SNARE complex subunit (syntaxin)